MYRKGESHRSYLDPQNQKINSYLYSHQTLLGLYQNSEPLHQILDHSNGEGAVFLGNIDAAQDLTNLRKLGIKAVLTVAARAGLKYNENIVPFHEVIACDDHPQQDLSSFFQQIYNFIEKHRKQTNILIHCFAGISRSSTALIMYMMRKYQWSFEKSFQHCRQRRRVTNPNPGFLKQLLNFEKKLIEQRSFKPSSAQNLLRNQNQNLIFGSKQDPYIQYNGQIKKIQSSTDYLNRLTNYRNQDLDKKYQEMVDKEYQQNQVLKLQTRANSAYNTHTNFYTASKPQQTQQQLKQQQKLNQQLLLQTMQSIQSKNDKNYQSQQKEEKNNLNICNYYNKNENYQPLTQQKTQQQVYSFLNSPSTTKKPYQQINDTLLSQKFKTINQIPSSRISIAPNNQNYQQANFNPKSPKLQSKNLGFDFSNNGLQQSQQPYYKYNFNENSNNCNNQQQFYQQKQKGQQQLYSTQSVSKNYASSFGKPGTHGLMQSHNLQVSKPLTIQKQPYSQIQPSYQYQQQLQPKFSQSSTNFYNKSCGNPYGIQKQYRLY
ncbi:hypothetical protein PPERSA_11656 [Pseudocohnilembus persalinus]|uniref:protein-tyrosine-phosphatase n=1 Tax=Pseudocohnilembus persalinus TaxID=266149 RepID=A0A0V0QA83_PSEPJ|nr:hypothetical protein PPERSA_11656 [Pseudocohnilembus persalinus]|eukprot:KRW99055.1 hypothetical protein PPERSA_11656 [Pseudocohnilembus persalinus]